MAGSVWLRGFNFKIIKDFSKSCSQFVRFKSDDAHVVMTDDSSVVVCWHPEKPFPYEYSRPIPEKVQLKGTDSVLKIQSSKEYLSVLKPKREEVMIEELTKLTYTTKHIWYPCKRKFRQKPKIMDRPYL